LGGARRALAGLGAAWACDAPACFRARYVFVVETYGARPRARKMPSKTATLPGLKWGRA